MGRKSVIFTFWVMGYVLGFIGFYTSPVVGKWLMEILPQIFSSEVMVGAFLSGIASSMVTTVAVAVWAKVSA